MKIIKVDNFDRDYISHVLVAENVSKHYATLITSMLNKNLSSIYSPDFYRAVEDDYKLYKFEP